MPSSTFILAVVAGTIVAGAANSLLTKYQDNQCVAHCKSNPVFFDQPLLQTLQMFVGEFACFGVWYLTRSRSRVHDVKDRIPITLRTLWVLALPAMCDILGTTMLNVGLTVVPVSVYQMLRGLIILFVALFLVVFLKLRVLRVEWALLALVISGLTIVSIAGSSSGEAVEFDAAVVGGILVILVAELFLASQFVVEEYLLRQYTVEPLRLVGYEGLFGTLFTSVGMVTAHLLFARGDTPKHGETSLWNALLAFHDLFTTPAVLYLSVAIMVLIAVFNFCGITITNVLLLTSRSTVDTLRTLLVWIILLALRWELWNNLQAFGFVVLVSGTLLFNKVVVVPDQYLPSLLREGVVGQDEREPLMP